MEAIIVKGEEVVRDGRTLCRVTVNGKPVKGGALFQDFYEGEKYWKYCVKIGHNPFIFSRPS